MTELSLSIVVPDAARVFSRSAEPEPSRHPAFATAPDLQRTASRELRCAAPGMTRGVAS